MICHELLRKRKLAKRRNAIGSSAGEKL